MYLCTYNVAVNNYLAVVENAIPPMRPRDSARMGFFEFLAKKNVRERKVLCKLQLLWVTVAILYPYMCAKHVFSIL